MLKELALDALAVSFAGGVIGLDRTAAFQTMASRPIVAAPLIGWLLGNTAAGLAAGIIIELLFIGDLPVGRYVPVHETGLAVLVAAVSTIALKSFAPDARASGAVLVVPPVLLAALPVSGIFQKADTAARKLNSRIFESAAGAVSRGERVSLARENLKGLALFFAAGFLTLFAAVFPMMVAAHLVFGVFVPSGSFYPAFAGCAVIGVATALNAVNTAKGALIFSASGALAAAVWMIWIR